MTQKRWSIVPHDLDRAASLERSIGVSSVVARLLLARGIDGVDQARVFLEGKLTHLRDPATLPGIPAAVERITRAIGEHERIVVYGDYDVDGMTATSILWQCLKLLGADVG